MEYVVLNSYTNYVEAHIARGVLEEAGINCWLKDENTVTIDPILTNAVGGIKIMVVKEQARRAAELLTRLHSESKAAHPCPQCGSQNVELVSTPRKVSNWLSVLIGVFITSYAPPVESVYHCFDCGNEWPGPDEDNKEESTVSGNK
jgi:predicted RNA-binding Zn-ribbon protein involved in translation (DUF1610 family)